MKNCIRHAGFLTPTERENDESTVPINDDTTFKNLLEFLMKSLGEVKTDQATSTALDFLSDEDEVETKAEVSISG